MTRSEYYNTYIYNLLMECYIEIETAYGRGNKVEHKKYPRPDPPQWIMPIISTDVKKEFEKDQRRWSFSKIGYYSVLHCELFFVNRSYVLRDKSINPIYISLLDSYESTYKELKNREKEGYRTNEEDDEDDEVERTNKELKEYIKAAKQDIESIKKNGYYDVCTSGYDKYASYMHAYLADIIDDLYRHNYQLWLKLDRWVVADLKNTIYQYETIFRSYPDNYEERIPRW